MQQTTFQEYLEHRLGHEFNQEEPAAQMEYTLTSMHEPGYAARLEGIRFKASTDYLHALDAYVVTLGRQGLPFQDIRFREDVLFSAQSLQKRFYELDQGLPIPESSKAAPGCLAEGADSNRPRGALKALG